MGESTVGRDFATALAAKDFERVVGLLAPGVDFRGLTPRRAWEASSAEQVKSEILSVWFDDSDHIDEVLAVETGTFADRQTVTYSFRGHNDDGPFVIEQQAYLTERDGRIEWIRVLCSGFRPG